MTRKKILFLLSLIGLLTFSLPALTAGAAWVSTDSGTMYRSDSSSKYLTGFQKIDGNLYYFDENGIMKTGWIKVGGKKYFARKNGILNVSMWVNNYYFQADGSLAVNTTIDGKWVGANGKYTGTSSTKSNTGWVTTGGKTYYYSASGTIQKGWLNIGKKTYYLHPTTGVLQKGWIKVGGNTYYASLSKGVIQKNKWKSKKYLQSDGTMATGWMTINGKTYCFKSDGTRQTGWVKYNDKYYYLNKNGVVQKNKWVDGKYLTSDGSRASGMLDIGSSTYYLSPSTGSKVTGWVKFSGQKYYFNGNGVMLTGIQTIGGVKYYFYSDGHLAVSTSFIAGAVQYTADANGAVTAETSIAITGDTTGVQIANFAMNYIGNPYVYGGTSLTNGADCSGFVLSVFEHFGYKLLRVADDQMDGPSAAKITEGYTPAVVVDMASILPGDLLFYGSGSYANHVAIYIGNGQIVHASNSQPYPKGGIKISNYNYQTPLKAVRYWS